MTRLLFPGTIRKGCESINTYIIKNPIDTLKVAVPSIVYYIQNNLIFIGATHLDAATCQITYQLKILTTALFSVALLRKRLFPHQWFALLLLFGGVALVQSDQHTTRSAKSSREQSPFVGFMAIIMACVLSG